METLLSNVYNEKIIHHTRVIKTDYQANIHYPTSYSTTFPFSVSNMSTTSAREINEKLREARSLPDNSLKVILFEEAIRHFDSLHNIQRAFDIRMEYVELCKQIKEENKMLVAFGWCLAQWDQNHSLCSHNELMITFQRVLHSVADVEKLSEEQILQLHDDYRNRATELGYSLKSYYRLVMQHYRGKKQVYLHRHFFELWDSAADDEMCLSLEQQKTERMRSQQSLNSELGEWVKARFLIRTYKKAQQTNPPSLIQSANYYAVLMHKLFSAKAYRKAEDFHRLGYRLIENRPIFLYLVEAHILYLIKCGRFQDAWTLFQKHLPQAIQSGQPRRKSRFFLIGYLLISVRDQVRKPKFLFEPEQLKLRIPASLSRDLPHKNYTATELGNWFHKEHVKLEENRISQKQAVENIENLKAELLIPLLSPWRRLEGHKLRIVLKLVRGIYQIVLYFLLSLTILTGMFIMYVAFLIWRDVL